LTQEIGLQAAVTAKIFGPVDRNARLIEDEFSVKIKNVDGGVKISGADESEVEKAATLVRELAALAQKGSDIDGAQIAQGVNLVRSGNADAIRALASSVVAVTARGKKISCKTLGQKKYVEAIEKNTLTFGIGPAGTGKTFLAVALAVNAYKAKKVRKIILVRPAIEAGEKLGFLPGDLQEKVDPYLRPLYDALQEMFGEDSYLKLIERGIIEIAPLAYMRGRTLSEAFIILDEAQNATNEQMKMFLTRMGEGSKVVVTGDITQIDLPRNVESGLKRSAELLSSLDDVAVIYLSSADVVRNELVQRIVLAYAESEKTNGRTE
jgi:phosphate starvation-inducible PhoH-like protein